MENKTDKNLVAAMINPHVLKLNLSSIQGKQKKRELIDLAKYIVAAKENIEIIESNFETPDFLIKWNGVKYGLEHTEVINRAAKSEFEKTESLVNEIEKIFLKKYGEINNHVVLSLKFTVKIITEKEKKTLLNTLYQYLNVINDPQLLFRKAYPGLLTKNDVKTVAGELADKIYLAYNTNKTDYTDDLLWYISFSTHSKTFFSRVVTWVAGSLDDLLLASIKEKEEKIDTYIQRCGGLKQCLFLIIRGSAGYSDYSLFNENILDRETKFEKVIVFNFFTNEIFTLK